MDAPIHDRRFSRAHQAGVVATIILWTLLSLLAGVLIEIFNDSFASRIDPPLSLATKLGDLETRGWLHASFALATSLLLVRFARVRRLWHAAILAVAGYALYDLFYQTIGIKVMDWLLWYPSVFAVFTHFSGASYSFFGVIHAMHLAIVFCAYRAMGRRFEQESLAREAPPTGAPPAAPRGAWGGTRAEWIASAITMAGLALFMVAGSATLREMQIRQIPAPVWALLRASRDLEFLTLTLDESTFPRDFHGYAVTRRFSASTPQEREALMSCLRRALTGPAGMSIWDSPWTHAIRATGETTSYDLLISMDGQCMSLYEGDKGIATIDLHGPFDELKVFFRRTGSGRE